jgi:hypothetical protein
VWTTLVTGEGQPVALGLLVHVTRAIAGGDHGVVIR